MVEALAERLSVEMEEDEKLMASTLHILSDLAVVFEEDLAWHLGRESFSDDRDRWVCAWGSLVSVGWICRCVDRGFCIPQVCEL